MIVKLINETNPVMTDGSQSTFSEIVDNNNNISINMQKHLSNFVKENYWGKA